MDLLIVGASARAAATSALRAGFSPHCIDLFADCDLRAIAPVAKVDRRAYPDGLEALAAQAPPSPWIYTGSLENHPELVDRISRARPLWGVHGATLRAVRDPFALADALHVAGLPCPDVRAESLGLPLDGSWLVKPLASAGGRGIRAYVGGEASGRKSPPVYYQERIEGIDLAAIFVADRSGTRLLGVTRQWIGGEEDRAPFAYGGSLGPWPLVERERIAVAAIGAALSSAFGLVGLFGVDLILQGGVPWPVEVNPRYTASVEVLEMSLGISAMGEHARCFGLTSSQSEASRPTGVVGKVILVAPSACVFAHRVIDTFRHPGRLRFADIPEPGTRFEAGEPVMTLLEHAGSIDECGRRLGRRVGRWSRRLAEGR